MQGMQHGQGEHVIKMQICVEDDIGDIDARSDFSRVKLER